MLAFTHVLLFLAVTPFVGVLCAKPPKYKDGKDSAYGCTRNDYGTTADEPRLSIRKEWYSGPESQSLI